MLRRLLLLLLLSAACDDKPKPAPAPAATPTPEATPTPPPRPTLPPTLIVDSSGMLVAGTRVTLDARGTLDRLSSELEKHRSFIDKQEVRISAERPAKPASVAAMLAALGAAGASRVLIRTSTRADFPPEVGFLSLDKAKSAPSCSLVAMITPDRGTAVWSLSGGAAGKRGKGMAGPDLTLTGETIQSRAKSCPESQVIFVAGAEGVDWGLVYDLAASTKRLSRALFADVALVPTPPVPGHPVELGI
jgi:biopolymer transport protein ExbD